MATDGAKTVEALREVTNLSTIRRGLETSASDYAVRTIDTEKGEGRFVVLIDTMTDSKLAIETISWETIVAPKRLGDKNKGLRYGNTIEVDGEIVIQEPYGLDFYQILANAARDFEKSPASVVYVLKTIFIGHNSDGTSEMISSVRPFNFVITDIVSTIDTKGTHYKLEIVGMQNGVSKIPQHALAAQGISIEVNKDDVIVDAVKKFELALAKKYNAHVDDIYAKLHAADNTQTKEVLDKKFQRVKYSFEVDIPYTRSPYTVATTNNKSTKSENDSVIISTGKSGTIESMLHKIMNSCKQVDADGYARNDEKKYYIYKLVSTVVPSTDDTYEIKYSIQRFQMIQQDQDGKLIEPTPGEFIEFDYMYTGLNVDVLEFNLKMDLGLSFFLTIATAPNLPRTPEEWKSGVPTGELTGSPNVSFGNSATNTTTQPVDLRAPLYLSTKVDDPLIRNKVDSLTGASYEQLFQRHAALEHAEAAIKIAGNPNLLDELVDTAGAEIKEPVEGNTGGANITRTPALVKVNVLFPSDNELTNVKEFWYKGFYNIYSITQNFDGGLFTQDIQMFSVPRNTKNGIDRSTGSDPSGSNPRNEIPVGVVIGAPCTLDPYPYRLIEGFDSNPHVDTPEFIQRVEEIAEKVGTLPEWLITMFSFETGGSFSPAQNTANSSAVGLIQFVSATAQNLGTTTAELASMTAIQQLTYVEAYLIDQINQNKVLNTLEALYTAIISGSADSNVNKILFTSPSTTYNNNEYLDINNDGIIRTGEAASYVGIRLAGGVKVFRLFLADEEGISPSIVEALKSDNGIRITQTLLDAVLEYQTIHGLVQTGYVNDEVVRSLFSDTIPDLTVRYDGCDEYAHLLGPNYPINQRNHNPLNIRKTKAGVDRWDGEVSSGNAFAKFTSPQYGLRAAMFLLRRRYFNDNGLKSVEQIINKWAPVADNSIKAISNYINSVAAALNVAPTEPLDIDNSDAQLIAMARAMAKVEGGSRFEEYPDSVYTEALTLLKG